MASSNKTEHLKLSLWEETDRPERLDFRQDNEKLEAALGNHATNNVIHVTASEKEYLSSPNDYLTFFGDGTQGRSIILPFLPKFVIYYANGKSWAQFRDGHLDVYGGMAYTGHSCQNGIAIENGRLIVSQQPKGVVLDGSRFCFNEIGVQYIAILCR